MGVFYHLYVISFNNMKIVIVLLIVWVLILNILLIALFRGFRADDKAWKSQIEINNRIKKFIDRQNLFNKNVQKYVIVNL